MTDPLDDLVASLVLRPLTPDDYDALVALQRACFPGMAPWSHREYDGQMRYFPQGQLGIIADGRLVASASGLIVSAADYEGWHDWREVSGNGAIANHDPEGDTLYGIEIQVHPDLRGRRLARRLYEARKELCRRMNLARIAIGGRIPGYSAHRDTMSAREFIEAVAAGRMYDPVLTSQLANGFQLEAIIPDYLPTDEDSAGYATSLIWPNLDYVAPRAPRRRRSAVQRVRVGAVQWQMRRVASWDEFVQQAEFFVDSAAERRTDVLVFPELFSLSLLSLIDERRPAEGARALAAYAPQYVTALRDLAMKYAVNVVGGSTLVVEEESGRLLNIAYVFHRDGRVESQAKLHPTPDESRWWGVEGGDDLRSFDLDCGRLGVLVCYDVQFPELARTLAEQHIQILAVPYNTTDRYGHVRVTTCARARAIENHLVVVTAGCVGNLPAVAHADIHYASSGVYTPSDLHFPMDGVASVAPPNLETVIVHEVDLELLRRQRREGTVRNWEDRRKDLYRVSWHSAEASRPG